MEDPGFMDPVRWLIATPMVRCTLVRQEASRGIQGLRGDSYPKHADKAGRSEALLTSIRERTS